MNNDAPICSPWDLCHDPDERYDFQIVPATYSRVKAQRNFANEMGVEFNQVRTRVAYVWIYSRQDAWEQSGWEHVYDDFIGEIADGDDPHIRLEFDPDWKPADDDGTWRWGRHYYVWISDGTNAEQDLLDAMPDTPPDDWEPEDYDPGWQYVDKSHPKAVKIYESELKEDT